MMLIRSLRRHPTRGVVSSRPLSSSARAGGVSVRGGDVSGLSSNFCAVLGGQWGDEGKGKLVDVLAAKYDVVARFNGGHNAGHTIVAGGRKFAFHVLPCGLLHPGKMNVIGAGVVLHVPGLFKELDQLDKAGVDYAGRLLVSDRAHLLFDFHQVIDGLQEDARAKQSSKASIGTTRRGIGPCYASKATRNGVRVGELRDMAGLERKVRSLAADLSAQYGGADMGADRELERLAAFRDRLLPMVTDTAHYVNSALRGGRRVLAEGANAVMLDLDHGTYPFVTSSSTAAGGICTGLGVAPSAVETTIGIVKAYTTRVGAGPFPTELEDATGQRLRDAGHEYGTTTGRPRRCGWLDLPVVQYGAMLNGYRSINITKLDVLSGLPEIRIGVAYELDGQALAPGQVPSRLEDLARVRVRYETMPGWAEDLSKCSTYDALPANARRYVERIEELAGVPVSWIGTGPGRDSMVTKGF